MAKDTSPVVKQSRREGYALHPKAHRVLARKSGLPGQHQGERPGKSSLFLMQLREKQKVRRMYGLLEKQFGNLMHEAFKKQGLAGNNLLLLLELRIDNAVYRAGFATSRKCARQLVGHGHFLLNNKRVNIPSIRLKPGDVISVRPSSLKSGYFKNINDVIKNTFQTPSSWLKPNSKTLTISVTGLPIRKDAETGINEQLIVEYYSR